VACARIKETHCSEAGGRPIGELVLHLLQPLLPGPVHQALVLARQQQRWVELQLRPLLLLLPCPGQPAPLAQREGVERAQLAMQVG
jgi:hypothetical protein